MILAIAAVAAAASCSLPEPFVYREWEYNRDHKFFPDGPKAIDSLTGEQKLTALRVIVCYAKGGTSPERIAALATEECRRYGMTPAFNEQTLDFCPLSTPVSAVYKCERTGANVARKPDAGRSQSSNRAPTTESSPRFLFNAPGVNDRREQK